MTTNDIKKGLKTAIKKGMDDKIRNCYLDYRENNNEIINVSVTYGEYGIDNVKLTLIYSRTLRAYKIFCIDGMINIYQINDINKKLEVFKIESSDVI